MFHLRVYPDYGPRTMGGFALLCHVDAEYVRAECVPGASVSLLCTRNNSDYLSQLAYLRGEERRMKSVVVKSVTPNSVCFEDGTQMQRSNDDDDDEDMWTMNGWDVAVVTADPPQLQINGVDIIACFREGTPLPESIVNFFDLTNPATTEESIRGVLTSMLDIDEEE